MIWDAARKKRLWQRQEILSQVRAYMYQEGFLEAETPLIVKGTCPDVFIDSVETSEGYLVTSTEYQIKRMIMDGFDKVFTLTKNFRAGDRGRFHSAEFTMLEWGRTGENLTKIEDDAVRFIQKAFRALHPEKKTILFNGYEIEILGQEWERLTVREAFKRHLGLEHLDDFSLKTTLAACNKAHIDVPELFRHDKHSIMSYLFEKMQGHLGTKTPTFLLEWPSYLTTSAPILASDPHVAERSELYMAGLEIADGFPFLTDAKLQRELFEEAQKEREHIGKPRVTTDERFLESLAQGMPSGAGMALGMDRLVMVLTGAESLAQTQAFSWEEV
jgi:lysyl-tRNA synthetase class 2